MSEIYTEGVKSIPCFDKECFPVGACVHVLEYDVETEEISEFSGLVKRIKLDELTILCIENRRSISAMKEKSISIDSVLTRTCRIQRLQPQQTQAWRDEMKQHHQSKEKMGKRLSFPHFSF